MGALATSTVEEAGGWIAHLSSRTPRSCPGKSSRALEEDGRLDESGRTPASCGLPNRHRRFASACSVCSPESSRPVLPRDLPGLQSQTWPATKTNPFALIAWEYGAPWNGAGAASVRTTFFHSSSFPLPAVGKPVQSAATPSALKIASSTCCVSFPSTSRTWSVRPAVCASSSRKRPARSPASPRESRAWDRSTLETSSGRPDASSATCASASSAGTTAEPSAPGTVGAERLVQGFAERPRGRGDLQLGRARLDVEREVERRVDRQRPPTGDRAPAGRSTTLVSPRPANLDPRARAALSGRSHGEGAYPVRSPFR